MRNEPAPASVPALRRLEEERRAVMAGEPPLRDEYLLTQKGWELADILVAISAWGDRWTAGEAGPPVLRPTARTDG